MCWINFEKICPPDNLQKKGPIKKTFNDKEEVFNESLRTRWDLCGSNHLLHHLQPVPTQATGLVPFKVIVYFKVIFCRVAHVSPSVKIF